MPNWCNNWLVVSGDEEQLTSFREKAKSKDTDLDFQKLLPCPEDLRADYAPLPEEQEKANKKKHGYANWYDWQVANWGTKWNVEAELENSDVDKHGKLCALYYRFDSAWSPPTSFFEGIAPDFPDLTFSLNYEEGGVGFKGDFKVKGQNVILDETFEMEYVECPECEDYYDKDEYDECPECGHKIKE